MDTIKIFSRISYLFQKILMNFPYIIIQSIMRDLMNNFIMKQILIKLMNGVRIRKKKKA